MYSEFSKSKISNIYNTIQLQDENEEFELTKLSLLDQKKSVLDEIDELNKKIKTGKDYRDDIIKKKHSDIDQEISRLNPDKVQEEINTIDYEKKSYISKINELKVVEPSEYYHEDKHDEVKEQYNEVYKEVVQIDTEISSINKLKSEVEGGIKCEHCGIELMNAAITNAKIAELDGLIVHKTTKTTLMQDLSRKEQSFVQLKKEFDEYEKNKLIKEKYEVSIESCDLKINSLRVKLNNFEKMQDKIKENQNIDSLLIRADLRIEELENSLKQQNNSITKIDFEVKSINEKMENNVKFLLKIEEEESRDRIFKLYLDAFGKNGISKIIMKTMMPLINSELQRLMQDSSYFRLDIRINEKNEVEFIMIDNSTGVEKLMVSGSGYEKTIASLGLRCVLSKVCSLPKPNVVVFDEVFGKISNDNLDLVYDFFVKTKDYFEKIFLITHNPLISQWSDYTIKIEKENNVSKLIN